MKRENAGRILLRVFIIVLIITMVFVSAVNFINNSQNYPDNFSRNKSEVNFNMTEDFDFGEIIITNAQHLDSDRNFISDIYDEVKEKDRIWSEEINSGEYIRVTYERNLTNGNVIDVFVRGNGSFEVYNVNTMSPLLGSSGIIDSADGGWKYITLESVNKPTDIFDFKISGSLEFDYIHDDVTNNIFPNSLSNEDGDVVDVTKVDEAAPGDGVTEITGKSSDPVNPTWIQCGYPSANLPTTAIVQNMTLYWGHNDDSNWALTTQDPYTGIVWSPDGSSTFFNVTDYTVSTSDIDENYTLTTNLPTVTQFNAGIYIRFIGYDSNAGAEDDLLLDYCYYTAGYFNDTISPTVSLNSPLNNSAVNSPITFNYTPSDNFALDSCELWGNWSVSFTERVISTTANAAKSVFAIDVDSDGDIDVLSASFNDDKIAWYKNNGSESFTEINISITANGARSVFAIDVDSDGDIDVLSASDNDDKIAWYENNGSESFTERIISTTANGAFSVFAIDVDSDGDIDVLSASDNDDKIAWYENNGSESFIPHNISTTANTARSVFAIDVDSDGDIDVLSASVVDDKIAWYENNGSESFTEHNISTTANGAHSVFAIDVDSDGDIDVLSASDVDDRIVWYENNGSESFTEINISITADRAFSVFAIDVDSDGDIDVLSASFNDDKIAWYKNNGSESFTEINISITANAARYVFAIDVDGDNDIDVLSASTTDDKIAWYENEYVWGLISTDSSPTNGTSNIFSPVNITDGYWKWNVQCFDLVGNSAFAPANYSLTVGVDTAPPIITIDSPTNSSFATGAIDYNITLNENLHTAFYSIDSGSNLTLDNDTNLHYFNISSNHPSLNDGFHNITFWVNDTSGNGNETTRYFTVDTITPNINFVAPTETNNSQLTRNYIQVNVTASDSLSGLDTITIFLYNSTSLVQSNISSTSPFFVNFTGLPDGNYFFNSTANDTAGNVNTTETRTVTTDTGAPIINYVAPTEASGVIKGNNFILINVTAGDPNLDAILIRLYNSTNDLINSSITSSSPNFINFFGLSDGLYFYNATANDTIGNNASLTTRNITLDTTNPSLTIVEPQNITYATTSLDINFTVTDANLDECWYTDDGGATNITLTGCANTTYTASQSSTTIRLYANDSAGNLNSTESVTFFVDSINPLIAFIAPTEANGTSKSQNWIFANVSVTEANFVNITYLLQNASGIVNETTYTTLVTSINWTNLNQSSVDYFYNVSIVDLLNNENSTETRTLTLITADTTLPTITIDSPTNTTFATGGIDYNITLDEALHTAFYSLDSGSNLTLDNDSNTHYFNISSNHPTLSDGFHNITFWVNDTSGNGNESTVFFTVDLTSPNIQFETPTTATGNFSQTFIEANVTASDSLSGLDTITITLFNSTSLVQENLSITSPLFVNFTGLPDETYTLNSTANDTAGNSNSTEKRTILLDTVNPLIDYTIGTPANGSSLSQDFIFVNITLTEINFQNITFRLYNSTGLVNETTFTTETLNINFTGLSDETYEFNVTTFDKTSNSNSTITRTVILDTGAPQITILHPQNISYSTVQTQLNYSVSDQTLDFCWYSLDLGVTNSTPDSSCPNFTGLTSSEGSNTWTVYANDSSGNENFSSVTFTVDLTAPAITLNSPADSSIQTSSTVTFNATVSDTNLANVTLYTDGLVNQTNTSGIDGDYIFTVTFADGNHNWSILAFDSVANSNQSATRQFTVDTANPAIQFVSPTLNDGANLSQSYIEANVTVSDANLDTITLYLYNTTGIVQSNTSTISPLFINFTVLSEGTYYVNATVNDTAGKTNQTETRTIVLDTTPSASVTNLANQSSSLTSIYWNWTNPVSDFNSTIIYINGSNVANTSNNFYNATGLTSNTSYTITVHTKDAAGNVNNTDVNNTASTLVSTVPPVISNVSATLITSSEAVIIWQTDEPANSTVYYRTSSSSILNKNSSTLTISHLIMLTSLSPNTLYYYNVSSCDFAGNCNTSIEYNFTTSESSPSSSSVGGTESSGGGGGVGALTTTTKFMGKGARVAINIEEEIHYIKIIELTNTSILIEVSSTPQQATLNIGEEKKFEITDDDFYDILVRLNGIDNNNANLTISRIHEKELFDIKLDLLNFLIQDISELVALITFENFGGEATSVKLLFIILNEEGKEVYSEESSIEVITEEILRKSFENINLDLEGGKYTFILTTLYNVNIVDEFRQEFEIIKGIKITGLAIDFVEETGKWWISGAIVVSAIGGLAWWLIVKVKRNHEKKRKRKIKYYEKSIFKKKRSIILIKSKKKIKSKTKKKKILK